MANIKKAALSAGIVIAIATTPLIDRLEGDSLKTYYDVAHVLTYCNGETEGAELNKTYTQEQCDAITVSRVHNVADQVLAVVPPNEPMPVLVSATSFTYNIGIGAFKKSSMLRKLKSGDVAGACQAMKLYVYAHGVKWPGLVNRREIESNLCMTGVKDVGDN